jgi:hypothetical protein
MRRRDRLYRLVTRLLSVGSRHHLYRVYDNEWWHFEYWPDGRPLRLPHPSASIASGLCAAREDRP